MKPVIQVGKIMLSISDLFTLYEVLRKKKHFNEWSGSTICAQLAHCLHQLNLWITHFPNFSQPLETAISSGCGGTFHPFPAAFFRFQHGAIGGRPRLQDFYGLYKMVEMTFKTFQNHQNHGGFQTLKYLNLRYFEIFLRYPVPKTENSVTQQGIFCWFLKPKIFTPTFASSAPVAQRCHFSPRQTHRAGDRRQRLRVARRRRRKRYPKRWPCTARRLVRETNGEFKANWKDFKDVQKQLEHACRWWPNEFIYDTC